MKAGDVILIIAVLVAGGVLAVHRAQAFSEQRTVIVKTSTRTYAYPSETPRTIRVEGALGETVVVITNNTARIVESACPNKTCVKQGDLSRGPIYCLPNGVFVFFRKGGQGAVDAVCQ